MQTTQPQVGCPAPDFELTNQHGAAVRLSDLRGAANVVIVFYPFAFTPTCTGELATLREEEAELRAYDAQLLAVSCDPQPALRVFGEGQGIGYSLLSDFWPHGEVARAYGVFIEERGFATRGTFVVDREGLLRWSVVNPPGEARDTKDYRAALAELAQSPLTPAAD